MPRPALECNLQYFRTCQAADGSCHANAGSHSFPYNDSRKEAFRQQLDSMRQLCGGRGPAVQHAVCVVCRRGNDSQHAVRLLREHGVVDAVDVIGGLEAWAHQADVQFPVY